MASVARCVCPGGRRRSGGPGGPHCSESARTGGSRCEWTGERCVGGTAETVGAGNCRAHPCVKSAFSVSRALACAVSFYRTADFPGLLTPPTY